ncbi:MAG: hypothetical protein WAM14_01110 [Candidatus Nitrosopolaris sp.]
MKINKGINRRYYLLPTIGFLVGILLFSATAGNAFAHMRQLLTIGGKQYLLEVGSQNEPIYVGDKTAVDFFAWAPDPKDPLNDSATGIKNITGLDKTLTTIVSAGPVSKRLDFTPNPSNTAEYDATFYPSAQTTYTYTLIGKLNNTPIHISYRCVPGAGDDTPGNKTRATISPGVVRDEVAGGFGCPLPRGPITIP